MPFINRKQSLELWGVHDIIKSTSSGTVSEEEKKIPFDYWEPQDATEASGRPITRSLAQKLIKTAIWDAAKERYQNEPSEERKSKITKEPISITFNKDLLLLLLSQKNCEGIRFYFAMKETNEGKKMTLVVVGVNSNLHDLSTEESKIGDKGSIVLVNNHLKDDKMLKDLLQDDGEDTIILEVGGHDTIGNFDPDFWN